MTPLKKLRKSELIVLLENRESAFTEQEAVIVRQKETLTRLEHENFELVNKNDRLTRDNDSIKNTLASRDRTIARQSEELNRQETGLRSFYEKCDTLERDLRDTKYELDRVSSANDTLLDILKKIQPQENQKPAKCEKGEWCAACHFNKSYTFLHDGKKERLNICMKNCSCNNFAYKEGLI